MSTEQPDTSNQKSSKKGSLTLFIILFIASLALSGFLFFKYAKNAAQIQNQNKELTLAYEALNLHADSLQMELDKAIQELQNEINKNLAQEDLKEDLRIQLNSKKRELTSAYVRIKSLINSGGKNTQEVVASNGNNRSNLLNAKGQIGKLVKLNYEYIDRIEQLQNDYILEKSKSDSTSYLARRLKNKNDSLKVSNVILRDKLSKVNNIRISRLNVYPIRERNGVQENVSKAKKTQRLKVSFMIQSGEATEEMEKELIIRIIAPNGSVLTQYIDELSDTDELFSMIETMTYDGSEKSIVYYYDQEAKYKPGIYQIEIYSDDMMISQNDFYLN
jgi:cell division protein ZapB